MKLVCDSTKAREVMSLKVDVKPLTTWSDS